MNNVKRRNNNKVVFKTYDLNQLKLEGFVKYNYFHKEQKRSFKKQIYSVENLKYNTEDDEYICLKY